MVSIVNNPFAKKVMVPYSLDALLNAKANSKKTLKSTSTSLEATIAKNKNNFEIQNVFYEDNGKGEEAQKQHRLVSSENI